MSGLAILERRRSAAVYPMELLWIFIVVRFGSMMVASGALSKPQT